VRGESVDFHALASRIRATDDPPPLLSPDGRVLFDPGSHRERMRLARYIAWWAELSDIERARYQAQLAAHESDARMAEERQLQQAATSARQERLVVVERRGVPAKDRERIVDGRLESTPALDAARSFLKDLDKERDKRILVLAGPPGVGKSVAAAWLIAACDRPALFIDQSRLVRRSRYSNEDMRPLEDVTLLAIDDLGSEYLDEKGSFVATLDGLINARYAEELPTVFTTNLASTRFVQRYGERIADRIREVGRFVELKGPSLRGGAR
jgi:DNA replication protein DnaC